MLPKQRARHTMNPFPVANPAQAPDGLADTLARHRDFAELLEALGANVGRLVELDSVSVLCSYAHRPAPVAEIHQLTSL